MSVARGAPVAIRTLSGGEVRRPPWWRRRGFATAAAAACYATQFLARVSGAVEGEAADTLFAVPIVIVGVTFGVLGGVAAGGLSAVLFAAGEMVADPDPTVVGLATRTIAFSSVGALVGAAATSLEQARSRFLGAFASAPNGIVLTGTDGVITAANAAAGALLGEQPDRLVGRSLSSLAAPGDNPTDEDPWRAVREGRARGYVVGRRFRTASGSLVHVEMSVARMPMPRERTPMIVHFNDVTRQRRDEQHLAYVAGHDRLTGLPNRRRFEQELAEHLAAAERGGAYGAVLLLDLDHFKYVNDTLGHATGDALLRAVAGALHEAAGADGFLARLGGDEFAVLLRGVTDAGQATRAAGELLASIAAVRLNPPGSPTEAVLHVTGSVGCALVRPGDAVGRLLTAADLGMYEAKELGRGRVVVHRPSGPHEQRLRAGFEWGERIWRALGQGRFALHLQPILDLRSGRVTQYEALIRLVEGDRTVEPAVFLAHAERLGLISDIDRQVVDEATALLARLPATSDVRLHVNLSGASLADPSLADWVEASLRRQRVSPGRIIFEVTETVAITDLTLAASSIRRLQALGCAFALDDFGVGVSSFLYLRELPFEILKIDGEFIRSLGSSPNNQVIVRAMVDSAHGLGKVVVAEFVDSADTLARLRDIGCDYAQGHFIGRPLPAATVLPPPG